MSITVAVPSLVFWKGQGASDLAALHERAKQARDQQFTDFHPMVLQSWTQVRTKYQVDLCYDNPFIETLLSVSIRNKDIFTELKEL